MSESNRSLYCSFQVLFCQKFNRNFLKKIFAGVLLLLGHIFCQDVVVYCSTHKFYNIYSKSKNRLVIKTGKVLWDYLVQPSAGPPQDQLQSWTRFLRGTHALQEWELHSCSEQQTPALVALVAKAITSISKLNFPCCLLHFHCGPQRWVYVLYHHFL